MELDPITVAATWFQCFCVLLERQCEVASFCDWRVSPAASTAISGPAHRQSR